MTTANLRQKQHDQSVQFIFLLAFSLSLFLLFAQKNVQLSSPDGRLIFSFAIVQQQPQYSVKFKGQPLVGSSSLGLLFKDGTDFTKNIRTGKAINSEKEESYELVVGKTKTVSDHYREVLIPLEQTTAPFRRINLVARAFNDGVAFRYEIPAQNGWSSYELTDEKTSFNLAGNPVATALLLPNFTTSHEGEYTTAPLQQIREDTLMDMPALFQFPSNTF